MIHGLDRRDVNEPSTEPTDTFTLPTALTTNSRTDPRTFHTTNHSHIYYERATISHIRANMSTVQFQHADIALPCTFVSLLITGCIIKAITSPTDKGFSTLIKATCAFVLVLVLTTATTKMLLQSNTKDEEQANSAIDSDNARSKPFTPPPDANKLPARRDDISSPTGPLSERAQRRRLQKQKIYERADREEEQRLRGILKEQVKRRNNELLGKRKEAAVEVLD
jgi:hypothetical protein